MLEDVIVLYIYIINIININNINNINKSRANPPAIITGVYKVRGGGAPPVGVIIPSLVQIGLKVQKKRKKEKKKEKKRRKNKKKLKNSILIDWKSQKIV